MSSTTLLLLFPFELLLLYLVSRESLNQLFGFFHRFLPRRLVDIIITILFLPGTIMHELAHFIMAILLALHVHEVSVLPEFEKDRIKLGKVVYGKKDVFRGILVGIAPIFLGLFILWLFSYWHLFPAPTFLLSVLGGYSIFVISTTMFSSKQDLVDLIYIIPIGIIVVGVLYIFNIDLARLIPKGFMSTLEQFIQSLNIYFLFSFIIHVGLIIVLKILRRFI